MTDLLSLIDGHKPIEECLQISVLPTIQVISHQHSKTLLTISNHSITPKTIGKGTKVATGLCAFEEITCEYLDNVNIVTPSIFQQSSQSCIDILTSKIHLSPPQRQQATQLLTEFQDVFSLSNSKIGRANVTPFDVQLAHSTPISTPYVDSLSTSSLL